MLLWAKEAYFESSNLSSKFISFEENVMLALFYGLDKGIPFL